MKNPIKVKQGKQSRAHGKAFELRVRADLEEKGWIVDRWNNQVEFIDVINTKGHVALRVGKLILAKAKWNNFTKTMTTGVGGFPDFIAIKRTTSTDMDQNMLYEVIGVEVKMAGKLDKLEKEKCQWYLDNNVFSKILIASKHKVKNRIVIEYTEFKNGNHQINE